MGYVNATVVTVLTKTVVVALARTGISSEKVVNVENAVDVVLIVVGRVMVDVMVHVAVMIEDELDELDDDGDDDDDDDGEDELEDEAEDDDDDDDEDELEDEAEEVEAEEDDEAVENDELDEDELDEDGLDEDELDELDDDNDIDEPEELEDTLVIIGATNAPPSLVVFRNGIDIELDNPPAATFAPPVFVDVVVTTACSVRVNTITGI